MTLLTNGRFILTFEHLPKTSLICQTVNLPSLTLNPTQVPTPFSNMNIPGVKPQYEPLNISFKLDENFDGYLDVFGWMNALAFPESFEQYYSLVAAEKYPGEAVFGDALLTVMTNSSQPNLEARLVSCSPVSLSGITFDTTIETSQNIDITATFTFDYMQLNKIS